MARRFDYGTFFRYYTDPRNVTQDVSMQINYYHDNKHLIGETGTTYVTIGGDKYYIKIHPQSRDTLCDGIHFTLPTMFLTPRGPELWDNHYHFGMKNIKSRNQTRRGRRLDVVYFHKTTQDPINTKNKYPKNCYFLPHEPIDNITKIVGIHCLETTTSQMGSNDKFPPGSKDLRVIEELIRRPFYGIHYGGHSRRRTKKRRGRTLHGTRRRTV